MGGKESTMTITKTYFKNAGKRERAFIARHTMCPSDSVKDVYNYAGNHLAECAELHEEFLAVLNSEKNHKVALAEIEKRAELVKHAEELANKANQQAGESKSDKPSKPKKEKKERTPEAVLKSKADGKCVVLKQFGKRVAELWIDLDSKKPYCDVWEVVSTTVVPETLVPVKTHGTARQLQFDCTREGKRQALHHFNMIKRACRTEILVEVK
jgi:hypothetical protein